MKRVFAALALLASAASASAQAPSGSSGLPLPAAVVEEQITVSSDYRGSFITVFGVNPDRRGRGDIVVVVRGPSEAAVVMRKRRVLGLWINGDPVLFSEAPTFFAVLSSRPLGSIVSRQAMLQYGLDPAASAQLASATPPGSTGADYRTALVKLRRDQGLYQEYSGGPTRERRGGLTVYPGGLFRAVVRLPANAPIAQYQADAYVFRDGRLISSQAIPITVSRVGIERSIHDLATKASWLYGFVTVALALMAGWVAAFLFRRS